MIRSAQPRTGRSPETPIWQCNYYDRTIHDEASLHYVLQYIHNRPLSWEQDQLHPDNPPKW